MTQIKRELCERELNQTSGGGNPFSKDDRKTFFYNSTGEQIGYRHDASSPICFVPCDKCGKPMHKGWFGWYCDPCSRHLVNVTYYQWSGTVEELKAAAG